MVQRILHSKIGVGMMVGVIVASVVIVVMQLPHYWGRSESAEELNGRWLICMESRKAYHVNLEDVGSFPAYSPFSKKNTGVEAELCYWTAEGKIKDKPVPVLLNEMVGDSSRTYCPECGRLVVARNPGPPMTTRASPTRAEVEARGSSAGVQGDTGER